MTSESRRGNTHPPGYTRRPSTLCDPVAQRRRAGADGAEHPFAALWTSLGQKSVDTTLCYARLPLKDGTVAAAWNRAIARVASRLDGVSMPAPPDSGQLLALVDALHTGTLNDAQRETVQALRAGILAMAEGGNGSARPTAT